MKNHILITLAAAKCIDITSMPGCKHKIMADPLEALKKLSAKKQAPNVFCLLFCTPEEVEKLHQWLTCKESAVIHLKVICSFLAQSPGSVNIPAGVPVHCLRNTPVTSLEYSFMVENCFQQMHQEALLAEEEKQKIQELKDIQNDQNDLIAIGKALSVEKDQDKLLSLILYFSRKITGADAGSIFLIEESDEGKQQLRFKYAATYSLDSSYQEFVMPLNQQSIAGYVAVTGEILNIPDVYNLSGTLPYSFNSSFDRNNQYRSKSMLVVPMRNHVDEVIGVIQLLNSKENSQSDLPGDGEDFELRLEKPEDFDTLVTEFRPKYEKMLEAIANQAAIALENNLMIRQIRAQFEEFAMASVTAIESRDPATSGHSLRVAGLCDRMALVINSEQTGPYAAQMFSKTELKELHYAALLHDYGKVYLDKAIFGKAKKLFPTDLNYLLLKLDYAYRYLEAKYYKKQLQLKASSLPDSGALSVLEKEKKQILAKIIGIKKQIIDLNEPVVQDKDIDVLLEDLEQELGQLGCETVDGQCLIVLSPQEKLNLSTRRGSLNPREREEIESHVTRSFDFVRKIHWPPEYQRIPEFAWKHHERLDGSGYPNGLSDPAEIPLQARMIAIADIFDALIASDRPYKKALTLPQVLKIMQSEADKAKIDKDLLDIFLKYEVYCGKASS